MSTIVSSGLVGVSIQSTVAPSRQAASIWPRWVGSTDDHVTPEGSSTFEINRKVPP